MDPETPAVILPPSEEATAAAGEAAVDIATVEAERDIAVAKIQAETTVAVIEAQAEAADDEDVQWLRAQLESLQARCAAAEDGLSRLDLTVATLAEQNAEIRGLLTGLIAASQPPPPPPSETIPETLDVPASVAAGPGEAETRPAARPPRERRWL